MMARTPDLSCNWSEVTSKPKRESISSWLRMRSAPVPASDGMSVGAISVAASGGGVSSAMLLHNHLFEEDVADFVRRRCRVHAAQQLFLQAQGTFRSLEV